jgi:L-arabinose isomerase
MSLFIRSDCTPTPKNGLAIEEWSLAGPSHHCAIGTGHVGDTLRKVAFLLDIPLVEIK